MKNANLALIVLMLATCVSTQQYTLSDYHYAFNKERTTRKLRGRGGGGGRSGGGVRSSGGMFGPGSYTSYGAYYNNYRSSDK